MDKKTRTVLIAVAIAGAAWLAYRWWTNRQSGSTTGLGTNLNSLPSALVGGSTGPMSGLQYYAGTTNLYVTEQVNQSATKTTPAGKPWPVDPPHWHSHPNVPKVI